jgi:hypothetical protein
MDVAHEGTELSIACTYDYRKHICSLTSFASFGFWSYSCESNQIELDDQQQVRVISTPTSSWFAMSYILIALLLTKKYAEARLFWCKRRVSSGVSCENSEDVAVFVPSLFRVACLSSVRYPGASVCYFYGVAAKQLFLHWKGLSLAGSWHFWLLGRGTRTLYHDVRSSYTRSLLLYRKMDNLNQELKASLIGRHARC